MHADGPSPCASIRFLSDNNFPRLLRPPLGKRIGGCREGCGRGLRNGNNWAGHCHLDEFSYANDRNVLSRPWVMHLVGTSKDQGLVHRYRPTRCKKAIASIKSSSSKSSLSESGVLAMIELRIPGFGETVARLANNWSRPLISEMYPLLVNLDRS